MSPSRRTHNILILVALAMSTVARAQVERFLPGHGNTAWGMAFSQDSRRLVTMDVDNTNVWSVPAFTLVTSYQPGSAAGLFHPDNRRLFTAAVTVNLDEIGGSSLGVNKIVPARDKTVFLGLALSVDGQNLALAATQNPLRVVDPSNGASRFEMELNGAPMAVAFSPDGKTLFAGSKGGDLLHINTADGKVNAKWNLGEGAVRGLSVARDGKRIAVCSDKGSWVWEVDRQERVAPLGLDCASVAFTPSGAHVLTTSTEGLLLWDTAQWKLTHKLGEQAAQGLAVSPDGRFVAASFDAQVRVFDLSLLLQLDEASLKRELFGADSSILGVEPTADEQRVLVLVKDKGIKVWDRKRGTPVTHLSTQTALRLDPRGRLVNVGEGGFVLTDPMTDQNQLHPARIGASDLDKRPWRVNAKLDRLLVGGDTVELWDVKQGKVLSTVAGPCNVLEGASNGALWVVGCRDATVRILDGNGKEKRMIAGHSGPISALALSGDGKVVATASEDGTAVAWDVASGKKRFEDVIGEGQAAMSVALSPDGSRFAAGSVTGLLRVYDLKSKQRLFEVRHFSFVGEGFAPAVSALRFMAGGKIIVSGSYNRTVSIWNVADGTPLEGLGTWRPYKLLGDLKLSNQRVASSAERALFLAAQDPARGALIARAALSLRPPLDYRDGQYTSLMVATETGNVEVARLLIEAGAEVNAARSSGETCLISAVRSKNQAMTELLLSAKADPNVLTGKGWTPIWVAVQMKWPEGIALLAKAGADVNKPAGDGLVPLTVAVRLGARAAYDALIAAGADASKGEKFSSPSGGESAINED